MQYFLSVFAFVLAVTLPATAEAPAARLTVILTPERVKASGLEALAPVLAVSPRGTIVVAKSDNLFVVSRREYLLDTPTPASDCAFAPDGALLVVSGRKLGYYAGGRFHPRVDLPENGMRLAVGTKQIYVYGDGGDRATSLYVVEPQRGHAKLCAVPHPIGAASVAGDTLYFATANDLYRLVPGGEINLICHLTGPAITSVAATDDETAYFIAGRTLYVWQLGKVAMIGEGVGDKACWQSGTLYILDTEKQSLIKLENLPGLGRIPQEAR
ncbi:MAG: hypothetical protein JW741_23515 [Sedimentisphaerales bacterium]|nr:hypothetical protein [Sedimentisphaerales bacterium]